MGTDTISGFERVVLTGDATDNLMDARQFTAGAVTLTGLGGNDTLFGGSLIDSLSGGEGDDSINGGGGNDALIGGSGNDIYFFSTATTAEVDTITELAGASEGTDTVEFAAITTPVTIDLTKDATLATHANRTLKATTGQAVNLENATGGSGNDKLTGNAASNRLEGREGADELIGGLGNDALLGGLGDDAYVFATLIGAAEADVVTELFNEGTDRLDFKLLTATVAVTINLTSDASLAAHTNRTITAPVGLAANLEQAFGGAGADVLTGNNAANLLDGAAGSDILSGGLGNDTLVGGVGNDALIGNDGNDDYRFLADTTTETDTLTEQPNEGLDRLDFSAVISKVTVNLGDDAALGRHNGRTVRTNAGQSLNFENATGGTAGDSLVGNSADNILNGGANNDTIRGGAGNDLLDGGLGNDALAGQAGNDTLLGQAGLDTLSGGLDNDSLLGGADNDTLIGGFGVDVVNGELGTDRALGGQGKSGTPRLGNGVADLGDAITAEIIDELFATAFPFE